MRRSEERILTTHVGSLPREPVLSDLLIREELGEAIDRAELARRGERRCATSSNGRRRAASTWSTTASSRGSASRPTWRSA